MKYLIFLYLIYLSNVSAEIDCSSKKDKILKVINQSNQLGYHLKARALKADRKIILGSNQVCELTDTKAKRHKVKCKINQFDLKKVNDLYCICGRVEALEKADEFIKNQCLIMDEIHD